MVKPEQLSDAQATRSISLPESSRLDAWRLWVAGADQATPPIDWFFALARLSDPSADLKDREPAVIERLGPALGLANSRAASDGAVFRGYQTLHRAMGESALEDVVTDKSALWGLFAQARMATFLPYRDGIARYLREVPIIPEGAVHAYVRVVAHWAWHWRGLAVATRPEYNAAEVLYRDPSRTPDDIRRDLIRARSALPMIVAWDLRSLLELVNVEAGDIGSSNEPNWQTTLAVETITNQLRYAVGVMAGDPSLSPLSAANLARGEANAQLGGALGRMRVRKEDERTIALTVLEQVRKCFLDPIADDPSPKEVEDRALLAKKFQRLRIALHAMGRPEKENEQ